MSEVVRIDSVLRRLRSRTVYAAKKGVGSFVTIDVGSEHLVSAPDEDHATVGDLHLWVYLCDWELFLGGETLLTSESPDFEFGAVLPCLVGKDLEGMDCGASRQGLEIRFSGGYRIVLKQNSDAYQPEDDLLIVYPYGEAPLGYRADLGLYKD